MFGKKKTKVIVPIRVRVVPEYETTVLAQRQQEALEKVKDYSPVYANTKKPARGYF